MAEVSLSVIAFDGSLFSDSFIVTLNVLPVNDDPSIIVSSPDLILDEDSDPISVDLIGSETAPYFFDVDGDILSFEANTTDNGILSIFIEDNNLNISLIPDARDEMIYVTAYDPSEGSITDT